MQTRHRIPTIFNLSMVDVLCCALGCIILLWLVYFKEARERSIKNGQTTQELSATKLRLDKVSQELTSAQQALVASRQRHDYLSEQLSSTAQERDDLRAKLDKTDKDRAATQLALQGAEARIAKLQGDLAKLEKSQDAMSAALAQKMRENAGLFANLLMSKDKISTLEKDVTDQKGQLAGAAAQAGDLQKELKLNKDQAAKLEQQLAAMKNTAKEYSDALAMAEARGTLLKSDLDKRKQDVADGSKRYDDLMSQKRGLEQNLSSAKGDLATAQKDLKDAKADVARLQGELNEAKLTNHGLAGEAKVLSGQIQTLKAATENRFAGIEMTGQRVIFLVDMSGSMGMKDETTKDPDKWPLLCEILAKLMQSVPDLKQFQVILFAEKLRYPLGNEGKWIDYKGPESARKAASAVLAIPPEGGTNMWIAFEDVFRYRDKGLDTVYFLSDGLPNVAPVMPANASKLSDPELEAVLGKQIRERLKTTWNMPRAKQRVRINAVGFYFDSPDVGAFLWALARENDGSFVGLSKP
jgi:predicted  nucleic acid-binding Zn-ribbon protein